MWGLRGIDGRVRRVMAGVVAAVVLAVIVVATPPPDATALTAAEPALELLSSSTNGVHPMATPDTGDIDPWSVSLRLDGDVPVVAYSDADGGMRLLRCGDARCRTGNVITPISSGLVAGVLAVSGSDTLALTAAGNPVIANQAEGFNGSQWFGIAVCADLTCSSYDQRYLAQMESDSPFLSSRWGAVEVDALDFPTAAFGTFSDDLNVVRCGNVTCTSKTVSQPICEDVGNCTEGFVYHVSLELRAGLPVLLYARNANFPDLELLNCSNADCSGHQSFRRRSPSATTFSPALALDGADLPRIVSWASDELRVLTCGDTTCSSATTSHAPVQENVGGWMDIAVRSNGRPVIAYYDSLLTALRVLDCGNTTCTSGNVNTVVDNRGDVGKHISIVMGPDGNPVIAYQDASENDLKLMFCDNPGCRIDATCNGLPVTMNGAVTPGNTFGTEGDDVILGWEGVDWILGRGGNDTICGGAGNDAIGAGEGNDTIFGGFGADAIDGHAGDDVIYGGPNADFLIGGLGNDEIHGGAKSDRIYGDSSDGTGAGGDDMLFGGDGSDLIYGWLGDDVIEGGFGADRLFGQQGGDTIRGGAQNDKIYGGTGNDDLYGGNDDDRIWGERGHDRIFGEAGNDSWLDGREHNDKVYGGSGNDVVRGGDGRDKVYGQGGNDDVRAQAGDDWVTDGGPGVDTCQVAPGNDVPAINCNP